MTTKTKGATAVASPTDRSIRVTCAIDAPRKLVWEAWTEPEQMPRWWVCETMSMPVCDNDLRVGGEYRFVARMEDGQEFPFAGRYLEIVLENRIVCTQAYDVAPFSNQPGTVTTIFEEADGITSFSTEIAFDSQEAYESAVSFHLVEGMRVTIDRFDAYLAQELEARWS